MDEVHDFTDTAAFPSTINWRLGNSKSSDKQNKGLRNLSLRAPGWCVAIPLQRRDCFTTLAMTFFIAGFGDKVTNELKKLTENKS